MGRANAVTAWTLVLLYVGWASCAQEWAIMPENAGWRVCGYEFRSWQSLGTAYSSQDAWKSTLVGLDDSMGCTYTDRVVFGQHDWPVGAPWDAAAMRAEVSRGQLRCTKDVSEETRYGSQKTCGGSRSNIGYHYSFRFSVATATTVQFRFGGDFGNGGTLVLDGQVIGVALQDLWWAYRHSRSIVSNEVTLAAGDHVFEAIGFENCCDGASGAQFMVGGGAWTDLKVSSWVAQVPVWPLSTNQPAATMSVYTSRYVAFPKNFAAHAAGRFATTTDDFHQWKVCGDGGHLLVIDGTVISTKSWAHNNYKCYTHKVYLTAGAHSIEVMHFAKRKINRLIVTGGPGATTSEAHVITLAPIRGLCFKGQKYFTLAEAGPMVTQYQCQSASKSLPASTTLAPNNDDTRALIHGSWFGTECAVLADGTSHRTAGSLADTAADQSVELQETDDSASTTTVKGKKSTSKFNLVSQAETGWTVAAARDCSSQGTMSVPPTYTQKAACCAPGHNMTQSMLGHCEADGCQYQQADDGNLYCSAAGAYTTCVEGAQTSVSASECTYQITITVASSSKDLSHTTLGMPSDLAACGIELVSLGDFQSPAVDPTTGLYGIKYDTQVNAGDSKVLALVTREYSSGTPSTGKYAVKGGKDYALGDLENWVSCGLPAPVSPAIVSSMNVTAEQQECGSGKLISAAGEYSADCSDGVTRRVMGVRSICDPGDIDLADRVVQNYVVLNGMRYATLDDVSPAMDSAAPTCGSVISMMPAGWTFAAYDNSTRLLAMFGEGLAKFGTSCLVYSDGRGRSHASGSFGEVCAENAIESLPVVGGALIRVFEHWCPARILIARKADEGESDTLTTAPASVMDKTRAVLGYHYATLDNSPPSSGASGCQDRPITLPSGWEIVPTSTAAVSSVLRFFPFSTKCVVFGDGSSAGTCGDSRLLTHYVDGQAYHTVTACDARVLLRHVEIFDKSMLAETCGVCTGWGDPHQVTFDRVRYDSYGGELVIKVLVPGPLGNPCVTYGEDSSLCDFNIYAWQVPLGRVSTNKGFMVQHAPLDGSYESIAVIVDHTIKQRSNIPHLEINGVVTALDMGSSPMTTPRGAVITRVTGFRRAPAWQIALANDIKMVVTQGYYRQPLLHYKVTLPKRFRGEQTVYGLCGDCDGNPKNDFYNPEKGEAQTIEATRRGPRNAEIQNKFINSIVVSGPNPFLPSSNLPEPVEVAEQDEACSNVKQKLLDLVDACCADLTGAELDLCRDEVCTTESCESMEVLGDVQAAGDEVVTGPADQTTCGSAAMSNVEFAPAIRGGRVYAVLDGAANDGSSGGSQNVDYAVPTGWSLAANDEINIANAGCFSFGTDCLVLADGTGVRTDGTADSCGSNLLLRSGQDGACLRPSGLHMRILLSKNLDDSIDGMLNSGSGVTTSNNWFPEDPSNILAYPADVEDPAARAVVRVDGTPGTVAGVFRRWRLADYAGVAMNHFTAPIAGLVWIRALAGASSVTGTPVSEWVYLELDVIMSDGVTITERYYDFSQDTGGDISHGWEQLTVDLNLPRLIGRQYNGLTGATVSEIVLHMAVHEMTGQVEFGEPVWTIAQPSQVNYIKQGAFNSDLSPSTGDAFANWLAISGTPTLDRSSSVAGLGRHPDGESGSLKLAGTGNQQVSVMHRFGNANGDLYDERAPGAILFCTWHKAVNIVNSQSAGSSLYIDFLCPTDSTVANCNAYANVLPTSVGTRGWYRSCHSFETRGYLTDRMAVTARLTQGASDSESYFDGVFAMPSCTGPSTKRLVALAYGDPHIITGDGVRYDAQWIGEYTVYNDEVMKVQQRHSQAGGAAVVSAVAILHHVSGTTIQLDRPSAGSLAPTLRANGHVVSGGSFVGSNVAVSRRGGLVLPGEKGFGSMIRYVVKMWGDQPDMSQEYTNSTVAATTLIQVDVQNTIYGTSFMAISFIIPATIPGNIPRGLLGNFNGDAADDFQGPDGIQVAGAPGDPAALKEFVEAWRVKTAAESIFTYGRGENMLSHYDPDFVPVNPADATEAERAAAVEVCTGLGVSGEQTLNECVTDVLVGGAGYAVGAASLTAVGYSEQSVPLYDTSAPFTGDSSAEEDAITAGFLAWALLVPIFGITGFVILLVCGCGAFLVIWSLRLLQTQAKAWTNKRMEGQIGFKPARGISMLSNLDLEEQALDPPSVQRTVTHLVDTAAKQIGRIRSDGSDYASVSCSEDTHDRSIPTIMSRGLSVQKSDEPDFSLEDATVLPVLSPPVSTQRRSSMRRGSLRVTEVMADDVSMGVQSAIARGGRSASIAVPVLSQPLGSPPVAAVRAVSTVGSTRRARRGSLRVTECSMDDPSSGPAPSTESQLPDMRQPSPVYGMDRRSSADALAANDASQPTDASPSAERRSSSVPRSRRRASTDMRVSLAAEVDVDDVLEGLEEAAGVRAHRSARSASISAAPTNTSSSRRRSARAASIHLGGVADKLSPP